MVKKVENKRRIVGFRYCRGLDMPVNINRYITCSHKECRICRETEKGMKEWLKKQTK